MYVPEYCKYINLIFDKNITLYHICILLFLYITLGCGNNIKSWVDGNGTIVDIEQDLPGICDVRFFFKLKEEIIGKLLTLGDIFSDSLFFQLETFPSTQSC